MKIIAYYRVSTPMQIDSGAGLAAQYDLCHAWAKQRGIPIEKEFTEKAISGAAPLEKRPALFQAIYELQKGDILLVARLDRLSRDLYGGIIIDELIAEKKAQVISVAGEGTEGEDPANKMIKNMFRVVSGFERNLTQFRIKHALAAKKARGEKVGGYTPFGYDVGSDGRKLITREDEQCTIRKMVEYRMQGDSIRQVLQKLNEASIFNRHGQKWNHMSIWNALKRTSIGTKNPNPRPVKPPLNRYVIMKLKDGKVI